jgi:hypothetical protein
MRLVIGRGQRQIVFIAPEGGGSSVGDERGDKVVVPTPIRDPWRDDGTDAAAKSRLYSLLGQGTE